MYVIKQKNSVSLVLAIKVTEVERGSGEKKTTTWRGRGQKWTA